MNIFFYYKNMNPVLSLLFILIYFTLSCSLGSYNIKKLSFNSQEQPEKIHHIIAILERDDHLSLKIDGKSVINTYLNLSSIPPVNFGAGLFNGKTVVIDCARSKQTDVTKEIKCAVSFNGDYIGLLTF